MSEIVPYPGNPVYGVTRDGRVFRIVRARFGRPVPFELRRWRNEKNGYLYVGGGNSPVGTLAVHRMVAQTFIQNPDSLPEVAHYDGDKTNNAESNLRWDTRAGNFGDKPRHGTDNRGEKHPVAKLTNEDVRRIRAAAGPQRSIATAFGVSRSHVSEIRSGQTRIYG